MPTKAKSTPRKRVKTAAILGIYGVEDLSGRLNNLLPTIEDESKEIINIQIVQDTSIGRCDALVIYREEDPGER